MSSGDDIADLRRRCVQLENRLDYQESWIERLAEVAVQAARGNLEPRLVGVDKDSSLDPVLREALLAVNHLLDLTDACLRESGAALDHAAAQAFHRRFLEAGMRGSFLRNAQTINRATDRMKADHAELDAAREAQRSLAADFEREVRGVLIDVVDASRGVREAASGLATSVSSTSSESARVRTAAAEMSSSMRSISTSSEQISTAMSEMAVRVEESSDVVKRAQSVSVESRKDVEGLTSSSEDIRSVIRLIDEISSQTNLLAL
ncbi:MAG: methyl-accepting chemotaxis protein, partial [Planctomycetota bacterium]